MLDIASGTWKRWKEKPISDEKGEVGRGWNPIDFHYYKKLHYRFFFLFNCNFRKFPLVSAREGNWKKLLFYFTFRKRISWSSWGKSSRRQCHQQTSYCTVEKWNDGEIIFLGKKISFRFNFETYCSVGFSFKRCIEMYTWAWALGFLEWWSIFMEFYFSLKI